MPIEPGTDAALALAMCATVVDEGLVDLGVRSQTDLALLVFAETGRFLRGPDVESGLLEDQFFTWHPDDGLTQADRASLTLDHEPALDGAWTVQLHDGTDAEVTTVWELIKARLADYSPEAAAEICGVNPEVIRDLARRVASKRTKILEGFNTPKYYHGDLMERSMILLLAVDGQLARRAPASRAWRSRASTATCCSR